MGVVAESESDRGFVWEITMGDLYGSFLATRCSNLLRESPEVFV